ncbi:hypothetical protein C8R43DRAFT_952217 [Mycena crocata]|nr:hypothetical protein C8R43DRAFT_952217 [Mycena crocata]
MSAGHARYVCDLSRPGKKDIFTVQSRNDEEGAQTKQSTKECGACAVLPPISNDALRAFTRNWWWWCGINADAFPDNVFPPDIVEPRAAVANSKLIGGGGLDEGQARSRAPPEILDSSGCLKGFLIQPRDKPKSLYSRPLDLLYTMASTNLLCIDCQSRSDERARAVAPYVPSIDHSIEEIIENKLVGETWQLDQSTNVPCCSAHCSACGPFLSHLAAAKAGFPYHDDYSEYRRQQVLKTERDRSSKLPVIIFDDDDPLEVLRRAEQDQKQEEERRFQSLLQRQDLGLVGHMELVGKVQAVQGRRVIDEYFDSHSTVLIGFEAALQTQLELITTSRDQAVARVTELEETLQQGQVEADQLQRKLEIIEAERSRKIPLPSQISSKLKSSDPTHPLVQNLLTNALNPRPTDLSFLCTPSAYHTLSSSQMVYLRRTLMNMKVPGHDLPPEIFGRWLQLHKHPVMGVPLQPDGLVDLRDVRGRNAVLSRVPPKTKHKSALRQHRLWLLAVLRVLSLPGAYSNLLQEHRILVAEKISSSFFKEVETEPPEDEVVRLLANQGLTTATADDAWQYSVNVLTEAATSGNPIATCVIAQNLLDRTNQKVKMGGRPQGINARELDQLSPLKMLETATL